MDIQKLAEELIGTCQIFDTSELTLEECQKLDEEIMLCECCGWWCETSEFNDEQLCLDCQSDNE